MNDLAKLDFISMRRELHERTAELQAAISILQDIVMAQALPEARRLATLTLAEINTEPWKQQRDELLVALAELIEMVSVPDATCSCHISPPCNDCVENGGIREFIRDAQSLIAKIKS